MPGMLQPTRTIIYHEDGTAEVTIVSLFDLQSNTMILHMTEEQFNRWQMGERIERAFPNLNAAEREFLMSGATPEAWDAMFKDEDQ